MKTRLLIVLGILFACAVNAFAQGGGGGKAEPQRIKFPKGKKSAAVSGKIYGDLQAEYVFTAGAGQIVRLKISSAPRGKFSAFKVLNAGGEPEFVSEYDSNYDYSFTAPYAGDYLVWVHFRPAGKVSKAKYNLILSVK